MGTTAMMPPVPAPRVSVSVLRQDEPLAQNPQGDSDQATLRSWRSQGPPQQGAQFRDSDLAIQCVLTLRAVYHLPLRATDSRRPF